jgi:hypothetical protein
MGRRRKLKRLTGGRPRAGGPCTDHACDGAFEVYSTRISTDGRYRVRYIGCSSCGLKPEHNKWIVPIEHAPPRRRR